MFHCRLKIAVNKIGSGFACLFTNVNIVPKGISRKNRLSPFKAGSKAAARPVAQPSCKFLDCRWRYIHFLSYFPGLLPAGFIHGSVDASLIDHTEMDNECFNALLFLAQNCGEEHICWLAVSICYPGVVCLVL
jgi:hypothetical protein